MSISSYASDHSAASNPHSYEFSLSDPSRQSGMVQPVVQEMFATVHAAGSSLLGLFTSCTTFDSTYYSLRLLSCTSNNSKKALLTSGDMAGLLCPPAVRTLPLPSPILSPSRFPYSGRYKRGMVSELRALQQPGGPCFCPSEEGGSRVG
eukprot:scaffold9479_cov109-Isochrysis_galbana.AAC.2